jgi:hypothetical protein
MVRLKPPTGLVLAQRRSCNCPQEGKLDRLRESKTLLATLGWLVRIALPSGCFDWISYRDIAGQSLA